MSKEAGILLGKISDRKFIKRRKIREVPHPEGLMRTLGELVGEDILDQVEEEARGVAHLS